MNTRTEMTRLRVNTAISMCIEWPCLIKMILSRNPEEPRDREEKLRYNILKELTKLEPSILWTLRFYNARDR